MTTSSMAIDTSSSPKHVSANGGSGRRKTSSQKKNKLPQRGMGIAALERLADLQEGWKKMPEIAPPPPPFNTFAPPQLNGAFQFRQPPVNYFNGVVGDHPHHQHAVYQNIMTNSELSSIQNNSYFKCVSDSCGACYKKKRISGGGSSTCSVNPYRNYAANNNAFVETIDAGRPRRIQVREVKQEVMPVNRNGMNLMTEYEFFPRKNNVGDAGEMMRTASSTWCGSGLGVSVGGGGTSVDGRMLGLRAGDGSCVTAITGNEEGCVSSLDLTLKLSY